MKVRHGIAAALAAVLLFTATPTGAVTPEESAETGCPEVTDSAYRLYTAGFGRTPDIGGLRWWLNEYHDFLFDGGQWSLPQMARHFVVSEEFTSTFEGDGDLSNVEFVRQMYRNVLGREGEIGGVEFWLDQLNTGMDRGTLLLRFAESPENVENSGTVAPRLGFFNDGETTGTCDFGLLAEPVIEPTLEGELTKIKDAMTDRQFASACEDGRSWLTLFEVLNPPFAVIFQVGDVRADTVHQGFTRGQAWMLENCPPPPPPADGAIAAALDFHSRNVPESVFEISICGDRTSYFQFNLTTQPIQYGPYVLTIPGTLVRHVDYSAAVPDIIEWLDDNCPPFT